MRELKGSVVKRGSLWLPRFRVAGRDIYGRSWTTKREADRERREMLADFRRRMVETGSPAPAQAPAAAPSTPSVAEYAATVQHPGHRYHRSVSAATLTRNEQVRLNYIEGHPIGARALSAVRTEDLQAWVDELSCRLKPATVLRNWMFLRRLFSLALEEGVIDRDPAKHVVPPAPGPAKTGVLEPGDVQSLPPAMPDDPMSCMVHLALRTGMRRSEIMNLEWDHVDFRRQIIHVPGTKSRASAATIPLSAGAEVVLRLLPQDGRLVFPNNMGGPRDHTWFTTEWRKICRRWRLPEGLRFHDLRATYCTLLIESGADIKTTQALMRHASPMTTLHAYARTRSAVQAGALDRLEAYVSAASPENHKGAAKGAAE